ncbi:hypothetical protein [Streptomyces inhibens]|uniref:hypothetical protein n=1 Tax=Streptomyces inhibens TaxID=2293571 RepID=UPI001FD2129C|nr:hypothetical protein [Streptomyces inhibens]
MGAIGGSTAMQGAGTTEPAPPVFTGDFEVHLTVRDDGDRAGAQRLAGYAAARGLKCVHIVLEQGEVPSQPMLTMRGSGTYDTVRAEAAAEADGLRAAGLDVVRTKIEATPWSAGVPRTDEEAARLGPHYYFEHHLKLLLERSAPLAPLLSLVEGHCAHLSRNARRVRADGRLERFVTQRCRMAGIRTAGQRLDELAGRLSAAGYEIASTEREFVVHDGNEALDTGWLDAPYAAAAPPTHPH